MLGDHGPGEQSLKQWGPAALLAAIIFVGIVGGTIVYEYLFGEKAVRQIANQIANASQSEWSSVEMQTWAERLGCRAEVGPLLTGGRVKPTVERLVACAEKRLAQGAQKEQSP